MAAEFADKSFSTEEAADHAFTGLTDPEFKRLFEGDDVTGVDREFAVDLDFVNGSETAEKQVAVSRAFDPEHSLAAEQRFAESLPGRVDLDIRV